MITINSICRIIMLLMVVTGSMLYALKTFGLLDFIDDLFVFVHDKINNPNEKTLNEITLECDINTLFFYEIKKRGRKYLIIKKLIDINFVPNNIKDAVNEYIQKRFDNWLLNIKNWGEQNKDIYAEALAAMPKLAVIYDVLKTLFVDQGKPITELTEQQFFTKLPLICELIDDANKKVFELANWESVKSETKEKTLIELIEKENNAKIQTAFSKLDAIAELNSNVELELLKTKYTH